MFGFWFKLQVTQISQITQKFSRTPAIVKVIVIVTSRHTDSTDGTEVFLS